MSSDIDPSVVEKKINEFLSIRSKFDSAARDTKRKISIARGSLSSETRREAAASEDILKSARAELHQAFPGIQQTVGEIGVHIVGAPDNALIVDTLNQAIGVCKEWQATGERPGSVPISSAEFGTENLATPASTSDPGKAETTSLFTRDPVQTADCWRRFGAAVMTLTSISSFLAGLLWVYLTSKAIEEGTLMVMSLTLGVGLVLLGKALMAAILFGAAYASARSATLLLLPTTEYLQYVKFTSKKTDELDTVDRVIKVLKEAGKIPGVS